MSTHIGFHGSDTAREFDLGVDDLGGGGENLSESASLNQEDRVQLVSLETVNLLTLGVKVLHGLNQSAVSLLTGLLGRSFELFQISTQARSVVLHLLLKRVQLASSIVNSTVQGGGTLHAQGSSDTIKSLGDGGLSSDDAGKGLANIIRVDCGQSLQCLSPLLARLGEGLDCAVHLLRGTDEILDILLTVFQFIDRIVHAAKFLVRFGVQILHGVASHPCLQNGLCRGILTIKCWWGEVGFR